MSVPRCSLQFVSGEDKGLIRFAASVPGPAEMAEVDALLAWLAERFGPGGHGSARGPRAPGPAAPAPRWLFHVERPNEIAPRNPLLPSRWLAPGAVALRFQEPDDASAFRRALDGEPDP